VVIGNVREIVGLYLNPPDAAVELCVDKKSQIQARIGGAGSLSELKGGMMTTMPPARPDAFGSTFRWCATPRRHRGQRGWRSRPSSSSSCSRLPGGSVRRIGTASAASAGEHLEVT
jgi:hypothetical protein